MVGEARSGTAEVEISSVAAGGEGVGTLPDGRVVFVHRTAPGDRVRIRLVREKRRWARGRIVERITDGPGRREAPCPFYARCGGCTVEHLRYRDQLTAKAGIVRDALERIGGMEAPPRPGVEPSPSEFGYRSRVSFHLRRLRGGRVVAGFHELDRPGRIVDLDGSCLLPAPVLRRAWDGLRRAWGPGARRLPGGRALRLTLRAVDPGAVLVVEGDAGDELEAGGWETRREDAAALVATVPEIVAVWLRNPPGKPTLLAGEGEATATWWGRTLRPGAGAFLQANREAAVQLHEAVLREAGNPRERRIVDAYCGVGSTGRRLARAGGRVVGIELDPEAVREARAEAPGGFTVLEGRVEALLPEALPAEMVVVNPPRAGLDEAVPSLLRSDPGVRRIVYVSCDPATLARDVSRLAPDFRVRSVRAFDLFPQTTHVETLLVLERPGAGGPLSETSDP